MYIQTNEHASIDHKNYLFVGGNIYASAVDLKELVANIFDFSLIGKNKST